MCLQLYLEGVEGLGYEGAGWSVAKSIRTSDRRLPGGSGKRGELVGLDGL